jgi:hypothetical protein
VGYAHSRFFKLQIILNFKTMEKAIEIVETRVTELNGKLKLETEYTTKLQLMYALVELQVILTKLYQI